MCHFAGSALCAFCGCPVVLVLLQQPPRYLLSIVADKLLYSRVKSKWPQPTVIERERTEIESERTLRVERYSAPMTHAVNNFVYFVWGGTLLSESMWWHGGHWSCSPTATFWLCVRWHFYGQSPLVSFQIEFMAFRWMRLMEEFVRNNLRENPSSWLWCGVRSSSIQLIDAWCARWTSN